MTIPPAPVNRLVGPVYKLCKNKHIFKKCYWGNFSLPSSSHLITESIINNRNSFCENHGLIRYVCNSHPDIGDMRIWDHCELYTCIGGYVYITSPYANPYALALAIANGLTDCGKLYGEGAFSYYIKFKNKHEFNRYKSRPNPQDQSGRSPRLHPVVGKTLPEQTT